MDSHSPITMRSGFRSSSTPKTILVLGAGGMLGHMLVRVLSLRHIVIGTTMRPHSASSPLNKILNRDRWLDEVDVREWHTVERALSHSRPHIVINCTGLIKQKLSADRVADAILINSLAPHKMATLCDQMGIRLIHLSTDCVFEGTPGVKHVSDTPNATDLYGTTKRLGEINYGKSITIRTGFVGRQLRGAEGLFEWVLSQRGRTISGFKHATYSGLTTMALSRVIADIVDRYPELSGLHQVAATPISKFELIQRLNTLLRLDLTILPNTDFICDRSLDGTRFTQMTNIFIPSWDDMLIEFSRDQSFYEYIGQEFADA
jgi:dTDP-4-dehydrorhamnose reductase